MRMPTVAAGKWARRTDRNIKSRSVSLISHMCFHFRDKKAIENGAKNLWNLIQKLQGKM